MHFILFNGVAVILTFILVTPYNQHVIITNRKRHTMVAQPIGIDIPWSLNQLKETL